MARFYRFNNAVEHVHKPEDVHLDYFMHFWTVNSVNGTQFFQSFSEVPWLDNAMYFWVLRSIENWNKNA